MAALLGTVLVAFTLRQAVAAVSPIVGDIRADFPVSNLDVGLLGTAPPLLFAASGFTAPCVARRLGLDGGIVLALVLITVGHLVRAFAPGVAMLLVGSIVAFAGTGVGNVLLPSVVRRYFPDRVALLTAVYACIVGVSTAVPAALAAPIAQYVGWRTSLAVWAVTSAAALVPWLVVLAQRRRLRREDAGLGSPPPPRSSPACGDPAPHCRSPHSSPRARSAPTRPSPGCRRSCRTSPDRPRPRRACSLPSPA